MLSSIGLSPLWALFMSLVIYAGSGQFLAVTLIASQTSLPQVALLTFLLNFRHFFYGLSMISRYKDAGARRGYLIFAMTDETYALLAGGVPPPGWTPRTTTSPSPCWITSTGSAAA